jgi:hypothetical protein
MTLRLSPCGNLRHVHDRGNARFLCRLCKVRGCLM